ncbi:MAG: AAA family ATPase [Spirochaetaceae bacterium]|jgi:hypothetical protein|nr:AAA family ATPase [Spirochaetaceae bacterium]
MNISQAKEEIKNTVLAYTAKTGVGTYRIPPARQRPVLLMGPPGIGKTAIMEQIAGELSIGLVSYTMTHHTRQSALGLPMIEKRVFAGETYSVTEYTMSEIIASVYRQIEEAGFREGILFLDEINCVSETLLPAILCFLQYKIFGSHKLPEGWIIAAAGNPVKYNQSARDFGTAILDRLKVIHIDIDFEVWKAYARSRNLHPLILSYLNLKPEHFYAVDAGPRGRSFITARGWEDLSEMILGFESLDIPAEESLFRQYIQHDEIVREFAIFFDLNRRLKQKYRIDEIPETGAVIPELKTARFDERLCVMQFLLHRLNTLAGGWAAREAEQNSLGYFINGLAAYRGDFWEFAGERVRAREKALETKRRLGLLRPGEEEGELLFLRLIKTCLAQVQAEGAEDPPERLRALAAGRDAEQADAGRALERALVNCFNFARGSFGKSQELVIFLTELRSFESAARFIKTRLPELYAETEALLDLKGREDELRSCLP